MNSFNRHVITVLAAFILLMGCGNNKKEVKPDDSGRVFRDITVTPVEFEENTALSDLLNPHIVTGDEHSFYVYNDADKKVYRFKPGGELINTIGKGEGRGPGEVLNVSSMSAEGDNLWMLDSGQASLLKFRKTGEFLGMKTLKGQAIKVLAAEDNKLIVMNIVNPELFTSMSDDVTDEKTNTFGSGFLKNQEQNVVSTFGTMLAREQGGFIYAPTYANRLYYYDTADSLEFMKDTPGGQDFQPSNVRTDGQGRIIVRPPQSEFETAAAALSQGYLYLVIKHNLKENTAETQEQSADYLIDVFTEDDAAYQYSVNIPAVSGYSGFVFFGNAFVTLSDGQILKFEIDWKD